jgi:hypothetical protein
MTPTLDRIRGPLSPIQLRELLARAAYAALKLKDHPTYHSGFDQDGYYVETRPPKKVELDEWEPGLFGFLVWRAVCEMLSPAQRATLEAATLRGEKTFLFDDQGEFIRKPFQSDPPAAASAATQSTPNPKGES